MILLKEKIYPSFKTRGRLSVENRIFRYAPQFYQKLTGPSTFKLNNTRYHKISMA